MKRKAAPIPADVMRQIPPGQRRAFRSAIAAIGGWDGEAACATKGPRRTWDSTRALVRRIEDESGLDLGALDAACLRDTFCNPLGLHKPPSQGGSKRGGRYCPDTRAKGGWAKALALALGTDRHFETVPGRPEWQTFNEALSECEDRSLTSSELEAVEQHRAEADVCEREHPDRVQAIERRAKARRLAARRPILVVEDDDDVPF
jgi:hypothetical protein